MSSPLTLAPLTGHWGGTHVGLELGPDGGRITYDCAAGSIGAVTPDAAGRFAADGTHQPGHGGPDRQGETAPSYAARFTGAVHGTRMTLTGRISNGTVIGPFSLQRGVDPTLYRCL